MKKAWKDGNLLREFNLFGKKDRTKYAVKKMIVRKPSKTKSGYSSSYIERKNIIDAFDTLEFEGLDSLKKGFKDAVYKSAEDIIKKEYIRDIEFEAYKSSTKNEIILEAHLVNNYSKGLGSAFNGSSLVSWHAVAEEVEEEF